MFCVFLVKKSMQHLSEKTISAFPVSPGSAEALVRWGGKIKYVLIAYFLCNIFAQKLLQSNCVYKIIASQRWGVFESQCSTAMRPEILLPQHNQHFYLLSFQSLLETFIRRSLFNSSSGSCHDICDVAKNRSYVWFSVYSCRRPGSR